MDLGLRLVIFVETLKQRIRQFGEYFALLPLVFFSRIFVYFIPSFDPLVIIIWPE